ncbi:MAG: hypothetical protein GY875_03545 [Gammaproteobacteria bacterium]|nr:hypothetical protein [Gammaproteobacteria bacterium]
MDSPRISPSGILGIVLLACAAGMQASVSYAQDQIQIETSNDRLWINTEAADLQELLQQLAVQSGFKLWVSGDFPRQSVSVHIEGETVEDTLRQLLADNSYALVFDDDAEVSALYLLPVGEHQSVNLELDAQSVDLSEQVLHDALASGQLSEDIKAAMLSQFGTDRTALQESAVQQWPQVMEKLIESLEQFGSASPETMNRLRQTLEREKSLAAE